jgi:hypothetical protein
VLGLWAIVWAPLFLEVEGRQPGCTLCNLLILIMLSTISTNKYFDNILGYWSADSTPSPPLVDPDNADLASSARLQEETRKRRCAEKRLRAVSVQIGELLREREIDRRRQLNAPSGSGQVTRAIPLVIPAPDTADIIASKAQNASLTQELLKMKLKCRLLRARLLLADETRSLAEHRSGMTAADAQSRAMLTYDRMQFVEAKLGRALSALGEALQERDAITRRSMSQARELTAVQRSTVQPLRKRVQVLEVTLEQMQQERDAFRTALQNVYLRIAAAESGAWALAGSCRSSTSAYTGATSTSIPGESNERCLPLPNCVI